MNASMNTAATAAAASAAASKAVIHQQTKKLRLGWRKVRY